MELDGSGKESCGDHLVQLQGNAHHLLCDLLDLIGEASLGEMVTENAVIDGLE